jgi:hypothetical protein
MDDDEYDGPEVEAYLDAWDEATANVPCATCGDLPVMDHDSCIANMPGAAFACCGHGVLDRHSKRSHCYVVFDDGLVLRDAAAHAALEMLGGRPAAIPDKRCRPTSHGVEWKVEE